MSTPYRRNKIKTFLDIIRRIENWPTAVGMRLRQHDMGLRMLSFRDGLNIICRRGTRDWDVVHELLFAGGYGRAMRFLREQPGQPVVLDLGGNIGLFSLLSATTHPAAQIVAYEPGPPNYRLFEMNVLANAALGARVRLHKEAVAGSTRTAEWSFDDANPGGSGLFATSGSSSSKCTVQIRAFSEVIAALPGPVALAKIDIEGAEFDLIRGTPPETWQRIQTISLELHDDPDGTMSQAEFLQRMKGFGFKVEEETVCSYFLHR